MKKLNNTKLIILISIETIILLTMGFFYLYANNFFIPQRPVIMVIDIDGEVITTNFFGIYEKRGQNRTLGTSSTSVIRMLDYFSKDENVKGFILEINSYGGQTTGKVEIERYIRRMNKPVISVIKQNALSSGYYIAASTNKIYAENSSKIGQISDAFVYINRNREGQEQVCHITCSNYKTITLDECYGFDPIVFSKLKSEVEATHNFLVSRISENRGLPLEFIERIPCNELISTDEALKLNLIDEIGTTDDALLYLEKKMGTKLWLVYPSK